MFTLSPGPSQLSDATKDDIRQAITDGVLELSHRSSKFTTISRKCIEELRAYLRVPPEYRIFYFDSATQVWHSLAANVVDRHSYHFVNGAFSSKAREASKMLGKDAQSSEAPWGEQNDFGGTNIPNGTELITVCFNETSTGVKMTMDEVRLLRSKAPQALLAVDITSCAGGIALDISAADIWYFSVQKCFGLPAGLAIAIISPRAYDASVSLHKKGKNLAGIWSWEKLEETMINDVYQTPQTPNVLDIYLLGEQCARWNIDGGLERRIEMTKAKKQLFEEWMLGRDRIAHFVQDNAHRSDTIFVVGASPDDISAVKDLCRGKGIELGGGYGKIKRDTVRIANFPAISEKMLLEALALLGLRFVERG